MRYVVLTFAFVVVATISILGFRGSKSTKPPIEIFNDMDHQPKYMPQGKSAFFADGRADRPVPAHAVARGSFLEDDHLAFGKDSKGEFARGFPMDVTQELLERGKDRYAIFCVVCHGESGDGNGITKKYGMLSTPSYTRADLLTMPEGEIFNTITNGKNTMGRYGDKLTVEDRWAIVAYLKVLQRAQLGTIEDVPADKRSELGL
ncbi:MAG: cytochrome c [Opitutaceae bacterium]|nr:cytochrome c [Opitutaceae bacterium]